MQAAIGRANWLGIQSDSWGVAHRLRVYKQFLAPMFEYGAPLVFAWINESIANLKQFETSTTGFKDLMAWIGHYSGGRHHVTANLCGLLSVQGRFQHLHAAYQPILDQMQSSNPLKQLLIQSYSQVDRQSFLQCLGSNTLFIKFKQTSNFVPSVKKALARFLRHEYRRKIYDDSRSASLTRLIPMNARNVPGLFMADGCLKTSTNKQDLLFQYRRGVFMYNSICACHPEVRFYRGHETCQALARPVDLTHVERQEKWKMGLQLTIDETKFTDVDFLLNTKRVEAAAKILMSIRTQLRQVYNKSRLEIISNST
jgi:hypothetical protein